MGNLFKQYHKNCSGQFSIIFSLTAIVLLGAIGVALDFSRLVAMKSTAQDQADIAALAAAKYMTESSSGTLSVPDRKKESRRIAKAHLDAYLSNNQHTGGTVKIRINDTRVKVILDMQGESLFSQFTGVSGLNHKAVSSVGIGQAESRDIDVALIADASGSMAATLSSIQTNMKDFTADLNNVLTSRNIESGNVRVKFLFYRDYMFDNHQQWTGHKMALTPGLEKFGAMYSSSFYDLPADVLAMDSYVDFFTANGGGMNPESGFEAIWHAIDDNDWKNGSNTVRAIVLWTDAPNRQIGDFTEQALLPDYFWMDVTTDPAYPGWDTIMGNDYIALSHGERETFMHENYFPSEFPTSMAALKSEFDAFHIENSAGLEDISTMTINVINNCWGDTVCGDWHEIDNWDGVELVVESGAPSESETYNNIVEQVADTVEAQLVAKELVIQY